MWGPRAEGQGATSRLEFRQRRRRARVVLGEMPVRSRGYRIRRRHAPNACCERLPSSLCGGMPRAPRRVGGGGAPVGRRRAVPRLRRRRHGVRREAGASGGAAGTRAHGGGGVPPGAVPGDAAGDLVCEVRRAGGRAERARRDARAERGFVDGHDLGVFSERTACRGNGAIHHDAQSW